MGYVQLDPAGRRVVCALDEIMAQGPEMRAIGERILAVGRSDARVLVTGETGTGKELVARALHASGARHNGPFVAVNCAAFPDGLIESELFGHVRGAFTGADSRRAGCFQHADKGTLFLDEVGELSRAAQAKLLRVLQEGVFLPVGGDAPVRVDVRVISATHRDLRKDVADGRFRDDLYFRLRVMQIDVPPLRARIGDLPVLLQRLFERFAVGEPRPELTAGALAALSAYSFPGNVRELENIVQHALVISDGRPIGVEHLPESLRATRAAPPSVPFAPDARLTLAEARARFERAYILEVLAAHGGRRAETARALGISRKCLWLRLSTYLGSDSAEGC